MKVVADLHTHTIASTHAFSTITEMIRQASDIGLYAIAITDHGRAMAGAPGTFYFESLPSLPKELFSVRVLKGIEANIIDYDGTLDTSPTLQNKLEWVVASMHTITLKKEPSKEKCTQAYLAMCDNPRVNVIAHSGSPYFAYDYETVICRCAQTGTLIEINNGSIAFRNDSAKNCREIAQLCKKHNARIVVNSDAHYFTKLGEVSESLKMLREIDFPSELVVNSSVENLTEYFKEKNIEV